MKEYGFEAAVKIIGDLQSEIKCSVNESGLQDLSVFEWIQKIRAEMLALCVSMRMHAEDPERMTSAMVYHSAVRAMGVCARGGEMYLIADYERRKREEERDPLRDTVVVVKGNHPARYQE